MHLPFLASSAFLMASIAGAASAAVPPEPPVAKVVLTAGAPPASPELVARLAELDKRLFDSVFGCKLDVLAGLVSDDFEFLHDKGGRVTTSGAAFVQNVREGCEREKTGENFVARRELVPGTMTVYVLKNFGAMQMGTHRFFAVQPGKPDRLTETGKFIDVWKQDGDGWKLYRVISYDHQLAEPSK